MPVGNMSPSGKSFSGAAEYDLAQGKYRRENKSKKPEILSQNLISSNYYKDIGRDFRELALENKRCKNPVFKFSISFDPKENLSDDEKLNFTKLVMLEMGITDEHQSMITRHSDKAHDHHHIIANRVGLDGKVINDSFAINRLETSCDKIEKQLGFSNSLAAKRRFVYDENSDKGYTFQSDNVSSKKQTINPRDKKKIVQSNKEFILKELELALSLAKSLNDLYLILQQNKINADFRFNKANKLTGVSFDFNNFSVKGSALGSKFKAANVEKQLLLNSNLISLESLSSLENEIDKEVSEISSSDLMDITPETLNTTLNRTEFTHSSILDDLIKIDKIINTKL
ncbi:relaxase/mobilization nuclease domain-containing protein [Chryseobacterium sp. LC2016-29]|uniref:relaxase/mobilization nuclease domain-containing protein n=1 Tax=Chryseobacterium sp. LC2016-29 TaxID=2897331 RepID=UPI001E541DEE|nr:relaxase/mobilization nuclease domain-containing protein [Chryseobacterium sp. LC2016-29]MCD0480355.1 relaxase/mobilization nuclease domain-containing protein [Chryseobacterium sp. LC2016-29]